MSDIEIIKNYYGLTTLQAIEDENTQSDVQVAAITSFIKLVLVAFLLFYIRHKKNLYFI